MMNLVKALFLVLCSLWAISANNGNEPKESPRKLLDEYMFDIGCTDKLVRHYVIQAATSGLSAALINQRLKGINTYTTSQVSSWYVF
jgi:hypothetical protein